LQRDLSRQIPTNHVDKTATRPVRTPSACLQAHAQVAELVDALASGASGCKVVEVRVLSWAPFFLHYRSLLERFFLHYRSPQALAA
jgi:hypothetical protein